MVPDSGSISGTGMAGPVNASDPLEVQSVNSELQDVDVQSLAPGYISPTPGAWQFSAAWRYYAIAAAAAAQSAPAQSAAESRQLAKAGREAIRQRIRERAPVTRLLRGASSALQPSPLGIPIWEREAALHADAVAIGRLRALGVAFPQETFEAARYAHLPLAYACALLQNESSRTGGVIGANLWGHDQTIFRGGLDATHGVRYGPVVTQQSYLAYKAQRGPHGTGGQQGVGPAQLTYWSLQDEADTLGGCWDPEANMKVGFKHMAGLLATNNTLRAAYIYNAGSAERTKHGQLQPLNADGVAYSTNYARHVAAWTLKLGELGTKPP